MKINKIVRLIVFISVSITIVGGGVVYLGSHPSKIPNQISVRASISQHVAIVLDSSFLTLRNSRFVVVIDRSGKIVSLKSNSGQEAIATPTGIINILSNPGDSTTTVVSADYRVVKPSQATAKLTMSNNQLINATFKVYDKHIDFFADTEKYSIPYYRIDYPIVNTNWTVNSNDFDMLRLVPLSSEASANPYIYSGIRSGNFWYENTLQGASPTFGIALAFASNAHDMITTLKQISDDNGIATQATLFREDEKNKTSYARLRVTKDDFQYVIDRAYQAGFRSIQVDQQSWRDGYGLISFNLNNFPGGLSDLRDMVHYAHTKGLSVGFHSTPFLVSVNDVSTISNPLYQTSLYTDTARHLISAVSPSDTTIYIDTSFPDPAPVQEGHLYPIYYWDSNGEDFLIENEIITCRARNTATLTNLSMCARASRGTSAVAHAANTTIKHLPISERAWNGGLYYLTYDSALMREIYSQLRNIYVTAYFDWVFIDGVEQVIGRYEFDSSRLAQAYYVALGSPDTVVEASSASTFNLYNFITRLPMFDGCFGVGTRNQQLINAINEKTHYKKAYFNYDVGWYIFGAGWNGVDQGISCGAPIAAATKEEILNLCTLSQTADFPFSIHVCKDCFDRAASQQPTASVPYILDDVLDSLSLCALKSKPTLTPKPVSEYLIPSPPMTTLTPFFTPIPIRRTFF